MLKIIKRIVQILIVFSTNLSFGQNVIDGKWISNISTNKEIMELYINSSDSTFSEVCKSSITKKTLSVYKCKFRLRGTNAIVLINGEKQIDRDYSLKNGILKFVFKDKKLRKHIPLAYTFTFKRK